MTRQATWLARWQAADLYLKDVVALRSELSLSDVACERGASRARRRRARAVSRAPRRSARSASGDARSGGRGARGVRAEADGRGALPRGRRARGAAGALLSLAHLNRERASLPPAGSPTFCVASRRSASRWRASISGRRPSGIRRLSTGLRRRPGSGGTPRSPSLNVRRFLERQLTAGDVRLDDLPRTASDDQVRDVLDTFRAAARIHPESLGAYVITMASAPSDVLAVEFLQMAAGTSHPQRVVPLFETRPRSRARGRDHGDLLAIPWYREPDRGSAGSDDWLLRFRERRGAFERRLGAVPCAGRRRRRVRSSTACT